MLDIPASKLLPHESVETLVVRPSPPCQVRFAFGTFPGSYEADNSEGSSARSEIGEGEVGNVGKKESFDEGGRSEDGVDRNGKRFHIRITTIDTLVPD